MSNTSKNYLILAVTLALAALYLFFGLGKFIDPDKWLAKFQNWGLPDWLVMVSGVIEVLGGVALLIPVLRGLAGIGLALFMIGAVATHVIHVEIGMIFFAGAIMVGSAIIGWLRLPESLSYLGLNKKVMA